MSHIAVIADFVPNEGSTSDVESILRGLTDATRSEPGCLQFDLYGNADGFTLVERYTDMAAIEAHRETDHYKAYRASIMDLLAAPIRVTVTEPLDVA